MSKIKKSVVQEYRINSRSFLNIKNGLLASLGLLMCVMGHAHSATNNSTNQYDVKKTGQNSLPKRSYPVASVMIGLIENADTKLVSVNPDDALTIHTKTIKTEDVNILGKAGKHTIILTTIEFGDAPNINLPTDHYYTLNPYETYLILDKDEVITSDTPRIQIPAYAKVGDSETYHFDDMFKHISSDSGIKGLTTSWSLTEATTDTAWLCNEMQFLSEIANEDVSSSQCHKINQAGDILDRKLNMPSMQMGGIDLRLAPSVD